MKTKILQNNKNEIIDYLINNKSFKNNQNYISSKKNINNCYSILNNTFNNSKIKINKNYWIITYNKYADNFLVDIFLYASYLWFFSIFTLIFYLKPDSRFFISVLILIWLIMYFYYFIKLLFLKNNYLIWIDYNKNIYYYKK